MKAIRYLAVAWVAILVAAFAGTLVWACIPTPPPATENVIVHAAPVKSLVEWWDGDRMMTETQRYFDHPEKRPPSPPVAYYVGSVAPDNLVMFRGYKQRPVWGPMAREEGYTVTWRGSSDSDLEIHVSPQGWSLDRIRADLERCEGKPVQVEVFSNAR